MFASGTGSMRGPRMKTPLPLLLLLLLTTLTGTVICQDDYDGEDTESETPEEEPILEETVDGVDTDPFVSGVTSVQHYYLTEDIQSTHDPGSGVTSTDYEIFSPTVDGNFTGPTAEPVEEELNPIIILIPVVLVVIIISMIVCCIFINRRWNQKARNQELRKEDPYLDGSSTEKVPMPMFEEDVPSVLELEMEEFDQWMQKDGQQRDAFQACKNTQSTMRR